MSVDIVILYSPAGLEIMGEQEAKSSSGNNITLRRPMVTRVVPTQDGSYGLTLEPFAVSNPDASVKFDLTGWGIMEIVPIQLSDQYLQFTSGIQLASSIPPSGIVLP